MVRKPTYAQLEQRVNELEKQVAERKGVKETLDSTHRKLRAVFDAIQENINVVDLDFNLTDVNDVIIKAFALPDKESVLGRKCYDVLKGRKKICPNCAVAEVYRTKGLAIRTSTLEDEISTGGRTFEIFAYPIIDRDGNLIGAVEFARDITERRHAEEALAESQEKYSTLVKNALTGIYIDQDGKIVFANDKFWEIYEYPREEFIGIESWKLVHPDDRPLTNQMRSRGLKGKDVPSAYEARGLTKKGETIWIRRRNTNIEYGGKPAILGNIVDITEEKRAEDALRKAYDTLERRVEERTADLTDTTERLRNEIEGRRLAHQALETSREMLSNVFNAIDDLLIVIDKDLRVVMSNWKGHEYLPEQERKGHPPCYSCFMGRQAPCEPCHALEVFATGKMKGLEHVNLIDGKTREVHVLPVFDDEQNVTMVVEHFRDITERKRAEKALGDSEETLKAILAASPVGIGLAQNRIIKWGNRALYNMLGYEEGSLEEINVKTIYADSEEYERVCRDLYPVVEAKGTGQVETKWVAKNGAIVDCYVQLTSLDESDLSKGVIVAAMDITQRKQAEKRIRALSHQLLQAQEVERQRLSRNLHDLVGQDLSALKIGLDTLFDDQSEAPPERRHRMSELSNIVQGTIMAVRDLAYGLRPYGLDRLGLVQTVTRYCEEFSAKSRVKVDFFSAGIDRQEIGFDTKIILYRIIQEAFNNVKKHANATSVTIRLVGSFPNIVLRIEDNGKGFDVKERLAIAMKEKRMGLRSMEERVALLDGKMRIESRAMQGTKILIEIPIKGKKSGQQENRSDC